MAECTSCHNDLPPAHESSAPCPFCGTEVLNTVHHSEKDSTIDTEEIKLFEEVDQKLYSRIKQIEQVGSWHLTVMAEILEYHVKRLSNSLNKTTPVSNRLINLSTHTKRTTTIEASFYEFLTILADFHTIFCRDLATDGAQPTMTSLWIFFEQTGASIDRLLEFHASVANLRFIRDSIEHRTQGLMMDWAHHELVCLEELRKQLNRKSNFEREQLKERSVQVTLAPPNLHSYFDLLDRMKTTKEGLE